MANKPKKVVLAYVGPKADFRRRRAIALDVTNSVAVGYGSRKAHIPMLDTVEQ
jgi:hypothetical protein